MEKEESFVNDQLNTGFVDGELNKNVSLASENNVWNLLDDPSLQKDQLEEIEAGESVNILDFSDKEIKNNSSNLIGSLMESSIRFKQKPVSQLKYGAHLKKEEDEDDCEDLKELYQQMVQSKQTKKR